MKDVMQKPRQSARRGIFLSLLLCASTTSFAQVDLVGDDTDLFTINPNISSQVPNVLIILDNTSNWASQNQKWEDPSVDAGFYGACKSDISNFGSQQGDAEVCALYRLMTAKIKNSDGTDSSTDVVGTNVNVGMMMYEDLQQAGAYVRYPMRNMEKTNKDLLLQVLRNISTNNPGDKGPSSASPVNIFNDAFRYFNNLPTYSGVASGNPGGPPPTLFTNPLAPSFATIIGGAHPRGYADGDLLNKAKMQAFKFPAATGNNSCGDDYIIFIGNGFPSTELLSTTQGDLTAAAALLSDPTVKVNTNPLQDTRVNPDMWSQFLYQYGTKQNQNGLYRKITTFTIDVCNAQCDSDWEKVLRSTATPDQSNYYQARDGKAILTALTEIFAKINAVNTVFAASTLPVSINVRGTNLNQVYIGVFRPDDNLSPRWWGNLKQYRLGFADDAAQAAGTVSLVDANGVVAVDPSSGFVKNSASSYWSAKTSVGVPGYWSFRGPGYDASDIGQDQDSPDGDLVEKGGAAQRIRVKYPYPDSSGQVRNIYTCTGACAAGSLLSDYKFDKDNADIKAEVLGTFVSTKVNSLVGSGNTATATIAGGHSFNVGDVVIVEGALPDFYNGQRSVTAISADKTTFSYGISPVPGPTVSPTLAYVTFSSPVTQLKLNIASGTKDKLLVAFASPFDYNTASTGATFSPVVGNAQQLSYTLASAPAVNASSPVVSAVRYVDQATAPATSSKVVYFSGSNARVEVTLPNHGYLTGDTVTIFGALNSIGGSDLAFNGSRVVSKIDNNSFSFSAPTPPDRIPVVQSATVTTDDPSQSLGIPPSPTFPWASNQLVVVCAGDIIRTTNATSGAITTACQTADPFNSLTTGVAVQNPVSNSFRYTTSQNVGTATPNIGGYQAALINTTTDVNTWAIGSATTQASAGVRTATLSLGTQSHAVSSQLPHLLTIGNSISVAGLVCQRNNGTEIDCLTGSTSGISTIYTVNLTGATGAPPQGVTFRVDNNVAQISLRTGVSHTVTWTPSATTPTFSKKVRVLSTTPAEGTVQAFTDAAGIYVYKSGDLSSTVSSITSQSVAVGNPAITAALLGAGDPAERERLIAWMRGTDNKDEENQNNDPTDVRASAHGDVLHSRPAVVNYNRTGDENDVYIFYGANDGMLHAIKGGTGTDGGDEQWAFVAPEFFSKLKRLRNQTPIISSLNPRGYFFDGSIAVYTLDKDLNGKLGDSGDKVYLYVTMRRGGRLIYAFDVTNPTAPKLLWKKGCREATGNGTAVGSGNCDAGFGEMGQTWSQPTIGYLRKWPDKPVLIVGAGYDRPAEDFQPCSITNWSGSQVSGVRNVVLPTVMDTTTCTSGALSGGTTTIQSRTMGRGVYILDAATGDILWSFGNAANSPKQSVSGMDYAIVGDMVALRNRTNTFPRTGETLGGESAPLGYFDRIYAADTGGQVWRIDVSDSGTPPNFVVSKLASIANLPETGKHAALNYRKFMVSPDVVYSSDANGQYDAVLLGSGDREHVWDRIVQNRFYMFKDRATASITTPLTSAVLESDLYDATSNCLQSTANCAGTTDADKLQAQADAKAALLAAKGWKLDLVGRRTGVNFLGEKTVAPATTAAGSVIFNTNEPVEENYTGQCSVLGTARQYGINYQDATATGIFNGLESRYVSSGGDFATFGGGGFLPQPVPAVVQIGGKTYQTVIAGVQTTNPGGLKLQSRVRTYWYRKID